MARTVTLVRGKQKMTASDPTTVTQLKSQGWQVQEAPRVQKPAEPKPAAAAKSDDK